MDVSIIAIDHFLKNNWIEIKARKIHPADCNLSTPRVISITRRTNGGWLLCRGVLPTRLNVLWIFYYLCAFPPGAGYIMQDARVLEGVHACVSSTTILARTPWMNLWEKGDIHIYIYIIFNLPFTFYAAALYRFQLIKPRISFKTRSKCNERRWTEGNFISGAPIK